MSQETTQTKTSTKKAAPAVIETPAVLTDTSFGIARNERGVWALYKLTFNPLTGDAKSEMIEETGGKSSAVERFKVSVGQSGMLD
jgi:hypothetical protein